MWFWLFSSEELLQLEKEDRTGIANVVRPTSVINFLRVIRLVMMYVLFIEILQCEFNKVRPVIINRVGENFHEDLFDFN
jgi:hypothetical protein